MSSREGWRDLIPPPWFLRFAARNIAMFLLSAVAWGVAFASIAVYPRPLAYVLVAVALALSTLASLELGWRTARRRNDED